jgi:hypothetical protein
MVPAGRRIEKKIPQVTAYEYKCAKGHAVVYEKKLDEMPPFCNACLISSGETNRYAFSKTVERPRPKKSKSQTAAHKRRNKK